jgi:two-component system NarL family sensor kinase
VIEEVRQVSRNLYPAMFETIGLQASIEALCNKICNETNLYVSCEIMYNKNLNINAELHVYRIIQESLQNTLKYANALAAKINLKYPKQGHPFRNKR